MNKYIKLILFILPFIFIACCNNSEEIKKFTEKLGVENKKELDYFISKMEVKLEETYQKGKACENYKAFLKNISSDSESKIVKFDSSDLVLLRTFGKSELEDQYEFIKFDTVYFQKKESRIVSKSNANYIEIEIKPGSLSKEEINKRIKNLKTYGIADSLLEKGVLWKVLKNNEMENIQVEEYFKIQSPSINQSIRERHLKFLLDSKPDYQNILIKSIIFYDIFIPQLISNYY